MRPRSLTRVPTRALRHSALPVLWVVAVLVGTLVVVPAAAQASPDTVAGPMDLDGPRLGLSYLSGKFVDNIDLTDPPSVISQFGWQFERRFFATPEGVTGVTEVVVLVGGVEHNLILPSLTWLVGLRLPDGTEFGVGPNLSLAGGAWVLAGGITLGGYGVNFPVNVALATSPKGPRYTVLVGFNVPSEAR